MTDRHSTEAQGRSGMDADRAQFWASIRRQGAQPDQNSDAQELNALDPETERKYQLNEDLRENRRIRKEYASRLMALLILQLVIMNSVFFAKGMGWLDFESNEINLFIGGTLAEIFGLVFVVTKYLFKENKPFD